MSTNELELGTWLSLGNPTVSELCALSGWDWVLLDLEHGAESEAAVPGQLRSLRGSKTAGIVRVGAAHADWIARVLDWGAAGIMVPHVDNETIARSVVEAAHYAPLGKRGLSRSVRAHEYGMREPGETPAPLVVAQIESAEGVQNLEAIAAVKGVDVLFVGPADLQFDLKTRPHLAPGSYDECLAQVVAASQRAGKKSGILLRDSAEVPRYRALGFRFIAVESDLSILRKAYQSILQTSR